MPSRRTVLSLCAVGLAGCSWSPSGDTNPTRPAATETDTDTTTPTPTPTPEGPEIDCERASRPEPTADAADDVEPGSYPDPPDGCADVAWAEAHEDAYRRNRFLAREDLAKWYGVGVQDSARNTHGDGVVVRIAYTYAVDLADRTHADSPTEAAAYYVDERGALRAHGTVGVDGLDAAPDPTTAGKPVVCF